jgi:hypothetical protein
MDDNSKYIGAYADLLTQIAENVEAVYAGGVKSEYDRFWDAFQDYGNRTDYTGAFKVGWNEETFKPKYDIKPISWYGGQLFQGNPIKDLKGHLERLGVKLDTSECTSLLQMFQSSSVQYIPIIDASNCNNNTNYAFPSNSIISIEKLIVSEKTIYGTYMIDSTNLESIIFEGTIANNGLKLSGCPKVNHESLMSIINCLKDFSGTGETRTCTLGATNLAKLTDAEKAIATEKGWTLA